jgi:hypothetical protein
VSLLSLTRWTFCGVQSFPGYAVMLLCNDAAHSTRALVVYSEADPVVITEAA